MVHVPLTRLAATCLVLVAMQGCRLFDDRCGPFIRELTVTGNTATPSQLFAQVSLVDQKEGNTDTRIFSWLVQGERGRIGLLSVDLVDIQTGEVWVVLPKSTSSAVSEISSGNSDASGWAVSWDDVRVRIANGRGRLRLFYVSMSDPPTVLPLQVLRSTGYEQGHCS